MMRRSMIWDKSGKGAIIDTQPAARRLRFLSAGRNFLVVAPVLNAAMQLIRRSLYLVLACLVLMWAGASFADDTEVYVSELGDFVQSVDEATDSVVDLDSPDIQDFQVLVSTSLPVLTAMPEVASTGLRPALRSVCLPITSPPPRRA
jgi:hypothetical protein